MGRSKLFGRMVAGVLVTLTAALSLTAAGASASSPAARRGAALAAQVELPACAAARTATVTGVTVTIEPCLTLTDDPDLQLLRLSPTANLTFSTDPNEPVDLCRVTNYIQAVGGTYDNELVRQDEHTCMHAVLAGTGSAEIRGIYSDPASPATSVTGWVTLEIASVDGPVQVISHRYTFAGPF